MKIVYPSVDSTFLIAAPVIIQIERIVISMGICQEFQGIYAMVRLWIFNIFNAVRVPSKTISVAQYSEFSYS